MEQAISTCKDKRNLKAYPGPGARWCRRVMGRDELGRVGHKTGQDRAGQDRTGQDRTGQDRNV
eukprot:765798-Hanusia_phi.AAC.2